jgi:predicted nucleic acid-binding protein
MEIVIDTSVLIDVIVDGEEKETLIRLTEGFDLVAPLSVHWEVGNAFSSMLKQKRITLEQSLQAIKVYNTIPIRFVDIDMEESLKISAQLDIYAYDAYLIYCALKYSIPLISLDEKLIRCARQMKVQVLEVSA